MNQLLNSTLLIASLNFSITTTLYIPLQSHTHTLIPLSLWHCESDRMMCPLKLILIFLSATLAGFFLLRNLTSQLHPTEFDQTKMEKYTKTLDSATPSNVDLHIMLHDHHLHKQRLIRQWPGMPKGADPTCHAAAWHVYDPQTDGPGLAVGSLLRESGLKPLAYPFSDGIGGLQAG